MQELLKKMTYGHYVLTALKKGAEMETRDQDYIAAGTINWASQVSFEPPMVAVAVGQKSDLNETIDYSGYFTLHLLSEDQKDFIEKFGKETEVKDGKINGAPYRREDDELILEDSLGYLKCDLKKSVNVGDHTIHFGEVMQVKQEADKKPICTMDVPTQYTPEKAEI